MADAWGTAWGVAWDSDWVFAPQRQPLPFLHLGPGLLGAPWSRISQPESGRLLPQWPQSPQQWPLETTGGPPLPGAPWVYFRPCTQPGRQVFAGGRSGPPLPGNVGGPVVATAGQPRLPRVPQGGDARRLGRFTEQLSSIINSLIAQGILVQTGPDSWTIKLPP